MAADYVYVNKTKSLLQFNHIYQLPNNPEDQIIDEEVEVEQGHEFTFSPKESVDPKYERILKIRRKEGAEEHEPIIEYLDGKPNSEKLVVYPICKRKISVTLDSSFKLELCLSCVDGCKEADEIVNEENDLDLTLAVIQMKAETLDVLKQMAPQEVVEGRRHAHHASFLDNMLVGNPSGSSNGNNIYHLCSQQSEITKGLWPEALFDREGKHNRTDPTEELDRLMNWYRKAHPISGEFDPEPFLPDFISETTNYSEPTHPDFIFCKTTNYSTFSEGSIMEGRKINIVPASWNIPFFTSRTPLPPYPRVRYEAEDGLPLDEKTAIKARLEQIEKVIPDSKARIGLSMSGGGMRAMIASCGFMAALKEIGILDATLYACGLSGSTWSLSKWIASSENPFVSYKNVKGDCWSSDVPPEEFSHVDISKLIETGKIDSMNWKSVVSLLPKWTLSRSLLKVYGLLLAKKLDTESIGNDYQTYKKNTMSGKYPIPVCTAAYKGEGKDLNFAGFTPFEIGSMASHTYFPVESYMIENYKGEHPPAIEELMAIWGSAFYAKIKQIIKFPENIEKIFGDASFMHGAEIINVNYGRKDKHEKDLPFSKQRTLYYKDAGIQANLPMDPLLRSEREINTIIVFDASDAKPFEELIKAIPAVEKNLPEYTEKTMESVFPCVLPATDDYPTIIYIPLIKHRKFSPSFIPLEQASTFKFCYEEELTTKLFGLAHFLTLLAKDKIWAHVNPAKN